MTKMNFLQSCNCGMCNHTPESECIRTECKCCFNFHIRSG